MAFVMRLPGDHRVQVAPCNATLGAARIPRKCQPLLLEVPLEHRPQVHEESVEGIWPIPRLISRVQVLLIGAYLPCPAFVPETSPVDQSAW
jgi:hypothetical protein